MACDWSSERQGLLCPVPAFCRNGETGNSKLVQQNISVSATFIYCLDVERMLYTEFILKMEVPILER